MDRASKKVSEALKKLRKITGEIQSTFADSIGVSFPLVRGIENGVRDISHITANKISAATGCNAVALMEGRLLNRKGKPYTKEDYKRHKSSKIDKEGYQLLTNTLTAQCKALLSLPSARKKIYVFETLFNQFMEQAIKTLGCGKEYDRALKESNPRTNDVAIAETLIVMRQGRIKKQLAKKPYGQPASP